MKMYLNILGVILLSTSLSTCTYTTHPDKLLQKLQWPEVPAMAKIQYIRSFSAADELGIERSFWQQVGDFFVGEENSKMIRPMAIVSTMNALIYVADPGAHGVHRFNIKQQRYDLIMLNHNQQMQSPVALTQDAQGDVFVSDSKRAAIYKITADSEYAEKLFLNKQLYQPTGILVFNNKLFVVDTAKHKIMIFDLKGQFIKSFGKRGNQLGEFNYPTMITHNSRGQILITDSMNFRVQIFNQNGLFIKAFGQQGDASGYMSRAKGIAVDKMDNIYLVDSLFHSVQLFDMQGHYLMKLGEQGQSAGEFWLPAGIFIDEEQYIYVADSHNQRVQVFKILGALQ